ncbi:MAG TPA: FAD-dependent oxidoreductase [Pseudonocardiaceae bacterium]
MSPHVVVVGGGVSGLAAAHRLRRLLGPAARITVVEGSSRLGGKLRTVPLAGEPFDVGAETFLVRRPEALALVRELGLESLLVHPTGVPARLHAGGRSAPLPTATLLGIPTAATAGLEAVLSPAALARLRAEPAVPLPWAPGGDVAVGELVADRLGAEVTARLVDPLLGGVYAGRAARLGLRATVPALAATLDALAAAGPVPSLVAAATRASGAPVSPVASSVPNLPATPEISPPAPSASSTPAGSPASPATPASAAVGERAVPVHQGPVFGALRGGMTVLVSALARSAHADVRLGQPVRVLSRTATGWRLELGPVPAPAFLDADAVVLAVPPPALRRLLTPLVPAAAAAVAGVDVASMAIVSLALPPTVTLPEASGVLVAAGEPLHAKAFTYSGAKWRHLGGAVLRASVGRHGDERDLQVDDAELVRRVRADLAELTGITAEPVDAVVTRWGGGLPQYAVGHADRVATLRNAIAGQPGLAVAGAFLDGVGIPACVGAADAAAARVAAHLSARMGAWHG